MPLTLLPLLALHLSAAPARAAEDVCYETTDYGGLVVVVTDVLRTTCAVELADGRLVHIRADADVDTCAVTDEDADGTVTVTCPPGNNDVIIWPT